MEAVVALLNLKNIPEIDSITKVELHKGEKKPFEVQADEKSVIISGDIVKVEFATIRADEYVRDSLVVNQDFSIKTSSEKSLVFVIKIKKQTPHPRDEVFDLPALY